MTRILVVDDERDSADSLGMLFEAMGHEVEVAYHGEQALSLAAALMPHIIFLDLVMPVLDGLEAARQIRASSRTDHPFIVALTGMTGIDVERETRAAGFDLYVLKPADVSVLMMIVDNLKNREHASKAVSPAPRAPEVQPVDPVRRELTQIVLDTNLDARYWTQTLGVNRAQLDAALDAVGNSVDLVKAYLSSPDRRVR